MGSEMCIRDSGDPLGTHGRHDHFGEESQEIEQSLPILGTPPRNDRDDHVCPKGHHGRSNDKISEMGSNLMNRNLFMDQESKNRQ